MARKVLIADACLAITFGNVGNLDLLLDLAEFEIAIGARALSEVRRDPARRAVRSAIGAVRLRVEAIDLEDPREQEALARFDTDPAFRGRGDAEVLALAVCRGYVVGSDDLAVLRSARQELGPNGLATTLDILVWAVRERRLSTVQAENLLRSLDVGEAIRSRMIESGLSISDLAGSGN